MQFSLISATGLLLLAPLASAADVLKQAPKEEPKLGSATSQGCFNSVRGLEKNNLELTKLSSGSCSAACRKLGKAVFATAPDGCYCGTEYPPKEDLSEDSACNNACPAYPLEACGGLKPKSYSVWNTGIQVDVSHLDLTVVERQDSPAINSGVSTAISSYYSSGYSSYPSSYGGSSGYSYPSSYGSSGYSYPASYDSSAYSYPTSYDSSAYSYPTSYGSSGYNYDSSVAASGVSTAAPSVTAAFASEAASSSSTGTATGSAASATTSTPSSGSRSMIGAGVAILAAALAI